MGVVRYRQRRIPDAAHRTAPLDECAQEYRDRHKDGDLQAPRWLLFMDANEYIYSGDLVSTLADVLATYSDTCCLKVSYQANPSCGLRGTQGVREELLRVVVFAISR